MYNFVFNFTSRSDTNTFIIMCTISYISDWIKESGIKTVAKYRRLDALIIQCTIIDSTENVGVISASFYVWYIFFLILEELLPLILSHNFPWGKFNMWGMPYFILLWYYWDYWGLPLWYHEVISTPSILNKLPFHLKVLSISWPCVGSLLWFTMAYECDHSYQSLWLPIVVEFLHIINILLF